MAFINEYVTQEDREKYFPKYEILQRYYPRAWTIDKEIESILFVKSKDRDDMSSSELEKKYGEYYRQWDIFLLDRCFLEIEWLMPKREAYYQNKSIFFIREVRKINDVSFNVFQFFKKFTEAMEVSRGVGVYGDKTKYREFEIHFTDMTV